MADQDFDGVAFAIGDQIAAGGFGNPNTTIRDLASPLTLANGLVLGDAESGDAESGIVIPNIVGAYRPVAKVSSSFTESADKFQKAGIGGLSISWVMQGNGATPTPTVGEADLSVIIPGLEALLDNSGLIGAAGGAGVEQDYTVRHSGSSDGATIYSTIKIWHGGIANVYSDCLVESLEFVLTPGGFCICTANILVGTFDHTQTVVVAFPASLDYEEMVSLAGPTVEGVAFTSFGQTRDFENLTIRIANEIVKFGASNVAITGERQSQNRRIISMVGTLYIAAADVDAAYQNLISATAPTVAASFQVGTPGASPINAFKIEVNNLQAKDIKYTKRGSLLAVELNDSKATATAAGAEFQLTMN